MPKLVRFSLVVLSACAFSFSLTSCSDDITCETDWSVCPPIYISMDVVNECVDSANAFQMRAWAIHPRYGFPHFFRWHSIPPGFFTTSIDTLAEDEFCLTISQVPGSEPIEIGESANFAFEFMPGSEALLREAVLLRDTLVSEETRQGSKTTAAFTCYDVPACARASGVGVMIGYDMSAGLEMEVFNANDASGADPVVLAELEWAAAADTLPIASLAWGDSLLELLTWTSPATNLPATLMPGQPPLVYDIPDSEALNANVVLVRVWYFGPTLESRFIFQGDMRQGGSAVRHRAPPNVRLLGNFPDPFSASTTIRYVLDRPEDVVVDVFDVRGKHVARIRKSGSSSGQQSVTWNGRDDRGRTVSSGVYFYRIRAGEFSATKKMVIVR